MKQSIGCPATLIAINAMLMGLLASTVAFGTFSSSVQENWYRYGATGFFFFGAILPGVLLVTIGRRSRVAALALTGWALIVLLAWCSYAINSGGGV